MNPLDDHIDRLFRAAGPRSIGSIAPFGLETRVLAAWREGRLSVWWNPLLLMRGLGLACLVMLLSFFPVLQATRISPVADYLQLADSTEQFSAHQP